MFQRAAENLDEHSKSLIREHIQMIKQLWSRFRFYHTCILSCM